MHTYTPPKNLRPYNQTNYTGEVNFNNIYKGIVIDNNDTEIINSGRVKVYIPEIHGFNLGILFPDVTKAFEYKFPGSNIISSLTSDVLEYLKEQITIWAPICSPIIGDTGPALYSGELGQATTSENPQYKKFNDSSYANLASPGVAYEYNPPFDAFASPSTFYTAEGNIDGYNYGGNTYSTQPKGVFAIPRVGSHVIIMFIRGDLNQPVVMGALMGVDNFASVATAAGPKYLLANDYQTKAPIKNLPTTSTQDVQLKINQHLAVIKETRINI